MISVKSLKTKHYPRLLSKVVCSWLPLFFINRLHYHSSIQASC